MLAKEKDQGYLYDRRCTLLTNVDKSRLVNESSEKDGTYTSDWRTTHSGCAIHPLEGRMKREREGETNNDTVLWESHASSERSKDAQAYRSTGQHESLSLSLSLFSSLCSSLIPVIYRRDKPSRLLNAPV